MPNPISARNPNPTPIKAPAPATPVVKPEPTIVATKPIYAPINGKEARQLLIKDVTDKINQLPLMKEGLAFHNIHMMYSLVVTCTPSDCPVPQTEFEKAKSAVGFENNQDWIKKDNAIKILEAKRKALLDGIKQIDNILNVINPVYELEGDLDASSSPAGADELRLSHDLPLPREVTTSLPDGSTKKTEELVHVDKSSVVKR